MYSSSNSYPDGNEGFGLPPIVLYGVNSWTVFGMFVHEDLLKESFMTVREFYELDCACGSQCV